MKFRIVFSLIAILSLGNEAFAQIPVLLNEPSTPAEASDFFAFRVDRFNLDFFVRLAIDVVSMIVLIRFIYYKVYGRRDFFFTFFMFNVIIFIITVLLNSNTGFSLGAAFGLFAIFAMLRYRTEDISTRDMTYLFMSITIGLISSINMGTMVEILIINAIILLTAYLIEGNVFAKPEFVKTIQYEKIDMVTPENEAGLLQDLRQRTGLNIHKVHIKSIDFLRDTAEIKVYYHQ